MTEVKAYKLYELSDRLTELEGTIELLEGVDIPADLHTFYLNLLEELDQTKKDFLSKVDSILCLIQSRKKWLQIRKEECERLQKLIKKDQNTVDWLLLYLQQHLEKQGIKKLRTNKFNLTIANNGGKLPVVIDSKIDPKDLPRKYRNVIYSPNKNAIREALEKGEELNFAYFGERGKYLRIK